MSKDTHGLHSVAFGMAMGVLWAFSMFLMGMLAMFGNWGVPFVELFSSFYIGYSATFMGSIIGAVWGFADGFIGGFLLGKRQAELDTID